MSAKKTAVHPTYKEMITQALVALKERNGSSRVAIKKYIHANFQGLSESADSFINQTIKKGVQAGDFTQPKGPSGPLKLVKKPAPPKKKPAAKPKKAATKKTTKKASPKKVASATSPKKTTAKAKVALKKAGKKTATKASPKKKATTAKKVAPKKAVTKKTASPSKSH